ncbi:hypothetical protein AVEN_179277-1 [Araneus ventricosus]|uniref:Uncharacterized protein n=1 Tax=Araneus ventricosus TaxID=182803 RepID=A0A4Y2NCZ0_ARAVE|nr:hypothetical protein AVEN_234182-1 [Araneus ventricosus]GBN28070.1 hypothetical protein AVEN_51397-1 [Araneus ventricosus]GBN37265.1 hypothetical protein AVEN_84884-1 [Araneus ventricosus]GBN37365.1 hypothetical protein AVEN_179277-1 [Araneus ventricosus]
MASGHKFRGSKSDSTEDPPCMYVSLLQVKSYVEAKRPLPGMVLKFGEEVPARVSSSSSDCGSKLRDPSENNPRVASKRNINVNKPRSFKLKH